MFCCCVISKKRKFSSSYLLMFSCSVVSKRRKRSKSIVWQNYSTRRLENKIQAESCCHNLFALLVSTELSCITATWSRPCKNKRSTQGDGKAWGSKLILRKQKRKLQNYRIGRAEEIDKTNVFPWREFHWKATLSIETKSSQFVSSLRGLLTAHLRVIDCCVSTKGFESRLNLHLLEQNETQE